MSEHICENCSPVSEPQCACCGGTEYLRHSPWHGEHPICRPCFMIWYDPDGDIDVRDPAQIGAESLRKKAAGKYPWTGEYAP